MQEARLSEEAAAVAVESVLRQAALAARAAPDSFVFAPFASDDHMAARYDITIEQGATFTFDLQVNDTDLTGFTVRMQGRTSHAATTTVFSLTNASGITVSHQGNHSHIVPLISATATAAFTAPLAGVYDIEYESGGVVTRILEGSFYITPEVTR